MENKFGLPQRTIDVILDFFKTKPEIEKVVIYGSRAKGTFKNGSDIDFAIWTDKPELVLRIAGELDDLPTPYKFDVVNYNTIENEALKNSINTDGKVFFVKS